MKPETKKALKTYKAGIAFMILGFVGLAANTITDDVGLLVVGAACLVIAYFDCHYSFLEDKLKTAGIIQ